MSDHVSERGRGVDPCRRGPRAAAGRPLDEETALTRLLRDGFEPVEPAADVWPRIEAELFGPPTNPDR